MVSSLPFILTVTFPLAGTVAVSSRPLTLMTISLLLPFHTLFAVISIIGTNISAGGISSVLSEISVSVHEPGFIASSPTKSWAINVFPVTFKLSASITDTAYGPSVTITLSLMSNARLPYIYWA